jgi:hypothetical protein
LPQLPGICTATADTSNFIVLQTTWQYQDQLGANPTFNCSTAYSTDAYDYYTGTSNYLRVQNSSLYVKNTSANKWAWTPSNCASSYATICEVPLSAYPCPPTPPPAPAPPPPLDLCEYFKRLLNGVFSIQGSMATLHAS